MMLLRLTSYIPPTKVCPLLIPLFQLLEVSISNSNRIPPPPPLLSYCTSTLQSRIPYSDAPYNSIGNLRYRFNLAILLDMLCTD